MNPVYIALGSNMGERAENIKSALKMLAQIDQLNIIAVSALYETAPVGGPEQGTYLNSCAALDTSLSPTILLLTMLDIEERLGRVRDVRWGPRIIDLDLLVYKNVIMKSPLLELPHPRMSERDFVLIPLADIAPDLVIPGFNQSVSMILSTRPETEDVQLYRPQGWYEQI